MGTSKRKLPAAAKAVAKERRRRVRRPLIHSRDLETLTAKLPIPRLQSKHHTYFEFVENKERKKKLHFQNTHDRHPPRGCEFVPIGNPELTTACKELSRERGVQIYIVSDSHFHDVAHSYASQMNRVGYHFHKAIVQEARATIVGFSQQVASVTDGEPEPIPRSQAQYHLQVDAALRDLFPRIPHTDRQMIIQHAFTRVIPTIQPDEKGHVKTKTAPQDTRSKGDERERVGLQPDVPLARRVQLAVLAHIRHTHTRYDELLKQSGWHVARKAVEALCLDVLVKWRGDEETGRDQLEEILREIVVISDSEDDELEQDSTDDSSVVELDAPNNATLSHQPWAPTALSLQPRRADPQSPEALVPLRPSVAAIDQGYSADRRARRGFQRYRRAWDEAIRRRDDVGQFLPPHDDQEALDRRAEHGLSSSHGSQPQSNCPAPNGYTGQGLQKYQRLPGNAPVSAVYGEVVSVAREQPFREAGQPVGHQFQDMLLRSVEPALPEPSQEDRLQNLSIRSGMHYRQSRAPSPAHQSRRGEYSPSGRRVMSDHWPQRRVLLGSLQDEGSVRSFGNRDFDFHPAGHGNSVPIASLPHTARVHGTAVSSKQPATDRIVVNSSWPGSDSGPILMEDRGGFFERVAGRPKPVPSPPRACEPLDVRRPIRETLRAPQGQPIVSRMASGGLPNDLVPFRSEVIMTNRSGTIPSAFGSQSALGSGRVFSTPWDYDQRAGPTRYSALTGGDDPHLRPLSGEYRPPSPLLYREDVRVNGQAVLVTHAPHKPPHRQCRKRPAASDYHYESFRQHPLRPSFTEHVDVTQ